MHGYYLPVDKDRPVAREMSHDSVVNFCRWV